MPLRTNIVIPTYQRASLIASAVESALAQSHSNKMVTVVDDGSTDNTYAVLQRFFHDPRFLYIQLGRNIGTARAKNVAIALTDCDAITFHDSDDRPHPDKVTLQARVLAQPEITAHPILNWKITNREPGSEILPAVALTEHELIRADGSVFHARRSLSLVDDFFPNLQMAAGPPGDWILINTGLFRTDVFARLGGFENCIEEDRELRNRLIMAGEVMWLIPRPLMTKIEEADSLTIAGDTDYDSGTRRTDRNLVWVRVEAWLRDRSLEPVPISLADLEIAFVSNPDLLCRSNALVNEPTKNRLNSIVNRWAEAGQAA